MAQTQFNLLPEVKQDYIKAARQKRTVIVISFLVAASTLFIFVMLFLTVHVFQKIHLNNLNNDIKRDTATLKNTPDIEKVLTIQNQLKSLPNLHGSKPQVSRLFGFMGQVTPSQVDIGRLDVDFVKKSMVITGTSDALSTVNKFVDTLKFTSYSIGDQKSNNTPFKDVVMKNFTKNDKNATYTINLTFNSEIFDNTKDIKLNVPKIVSSRSDVEKPTELFKALPEVKEGQ